MIEEEKRLEDLPDIDKYVLGMKGLEGYIQLLDQFKEKGEVFSSLSDGILYSSCESKSCKNKDTKQNLTLSMIMGLEVLWLCRSCIDGMRSFGGDWISSSLEITPDGKKVFLFGVKRME